MPLRKRKPASRLSTKNLEDVQSADGKVSNATMANVFRRQPVWILLALASGACAAFNGVFAKLTTTQLTSTLSASIASLLKLSPDNKVVDFVTRAFFFGMNLLFNGAMWALFTAALVRGSSTTRVSIVNVSANFMVTALLGLMIFGEKLPPMWWLGAGLLAGGNVVIGRREDGEKPGGTVGLDETREEAEELLLREEVNDNVRLNRTSIDTAKRRSEDEEGKRIREGEDIDDPI